MQSICEQIHIDEAVKDQISKTLLNHLYEGIYFVDKNRVFKYWNKGAENISGYKSSEILGRSCYDDILCHINDEGEVLCINKCPLSKCMELDMYLDARVYLKHKDGHRVPVRVHVSPLKNQEGEIIGAVEIFIDDSAYDMLKLANIELERLNKQKNEFLGMAVHDLRTPLSVVTGFSSILLGYTALDEKQSSMLQRIKNACSTMLNIINNLLDITAIESGKIILKKKPASIEDLLDVDNLSMTLMADQKGIDLEIIIEPDLPKISIDIKRINQVIDNLISNAVKFSYSGTKITINTYLEGNEICISVKDQGQGISEDDLPKLFRPFQKTATVPTGDESSTGLGLVIVKKIIEFHNGKIEFNSELNKGTEFIVKLPINEKC